MSRLLILVLSAITNAHPYRQASLMMITKARTRSKTEDDDL